VKHTIHGHHHHWRWDNALAPAIAVAPGDVVEVETLDPGGGQITPASVPADLERLDFARVNPVTGPVFVDGAMPGDALRVHILSVTPAGWGWTGLIPAFGLLSEDFPDPALHLWTYDPTPGRPAHFGGLARVPVKPMIGSIGLAPAKAGAHDILPPRRVGGTMDIRDMGEGTELYLPVEVAGGLLSFGDGHAAQGEGEVCGTGLETALKLTARIDLMKGLALEAPEFVTAGPVQRHLDAKGYYVTTGIGPSLMQGAVDAVRRMIDLLARRHQLRPEDAYMLCSVCADLRISEIVDRPNWVVSLYFPRVAFD
jgi:acetamidase/formamidase